MAKLIGYALAVAFLTRASFAIADHPTLIGADDEITVSFVFPGGAEKSTTLTHPKTGRIFKEKPLPKSLSPTPYKIDYWVYAALQDLDLKFQTEAVTKNSTSVRQIVAIDGVRSGPAGRWVYFVNGVRSRYHINAQLDENVKTIRFVYEK